MAQVQMERQVAMRDVFGDVLLELSLTDSRILA
jgi:hypothetical protein